VLIDIIIASQKRRTEGSFRSQGQLHIIYRL